MDLKAGEVWQEIAKDLEEEGIQPVEVFKTTFFFLNFGGFPL